MNIFINAKPKAYEAKKVEERALTVGELTDILSNFDEDDRVILRFDNGYSYAPVKENDIISEDDLED